MTKKLSWNNEEDRIELLKKQIDLYNNDKSIARLGMSMDPVKYLNVYYQLTLPWLISRIEQLEAEKEDICYMRHRWLPSLEGNGCVCGNCGKRKN
jgi:hypothetical protein